MSPRSGPQTGGAERRPAVSVLVPFRGDTAAAEALATALERLRLRPGDEVIVADNNPGQQVFRTGSSSGPVVVRATRESSSYHARNTAAERASNDWLLFMDADCRPDPDLLDRYFDDPVPERCAIVAGGLAGAADQRGLLPSWARSRRQMSEDHLVDRQGERPYPATGTGNMLVRRRAFEAHGGFHEGVRSGADVEFCWRVQDAGWTLLHRPGARVEHRYGDRLRGLINQSARHAAGRLWVARRYPGAFPRPRLARDLSRSAAGALVWLLALRPRRACFKVIDGIALVSGAAGWWLGRNHVAAAREGEPARPGGPGSLLVITDAFPARSETFVYNEALALVRQGWSLRVESLARPARVERAVARQLAISYVEDDSPRDKLRDLAWLLCRHPLRCLRDRWDARRWAAEEDVWSLAAIAPAARRTARNREPHVHAHFAAGGALQAMRISRLLGVPYSLTAHAYDIFQRPRNLPEKLRGASFAAAECEYAADCLRALAPDAAARVHRIATGTDGTRFQRTRPYASSGRVLAIARLVEKKGFEHLIRAADILRADPRVAEVMIAGEGPLDGELRAMIEQLELGDRVRMLGATWGPGAVRDLLEDAEVLAIPSVIAPDGDRDALPLVAYEALAMEVPVVASDLVGLPELIRPPWGRLVPPGDHAALARAIAGVLAQPLEERRAAGAAGRRFVLEGFDPEREAARLGELIAAA